MQLRFRLEAASDVVSARDWYDEQQPGLGSHFVSALQNTIQLIAEFPEAFPEIAVGHRRAILKRFPFVVYYRTSADGIEVLACLHGSRAPESWRSRDRA